LRWLAVAGGVVLIVGVTAHVVVTLADATGFARANACQLECAFRRRDGSRAVSVGSPCAFLAAVALAL